MARTHGATTVNRHGVSAAAPHRTGCRTAEISFALQTASYSWAWSETLIQGETEKLSSLEAALSRVAHQPLRPLLDSIVTEYRKLLDRKKLVDADVDYNWLWQAAVARSPAPFDRATSLSTALLQLQSLRRSLDGEA